MHHKMNDFDELRERAEEEDRQVRCSHCNELYHRDMIHICADNEEERSRSRLPINVPQTRILDDLSIIRPRGQPITRGREVNQSRPGMDEEIQRTVRAMHDAASAAGGVPMLVACAGCGENKEIGTPCPCGYTAEREARALLDTFNRAFPEAASYVQAMAGRRRLFHGTVSGRMSSQTPNISNIPRPASDEMPEQRQERCHCCDNTRQVALRLPNGQPVCERCVGEGRHRTTSPNTPYVYQVACRHCRAANTFATLAMARRSMTDQNGTCSSCGHYALGVEERRANDPRLDEERERERLARIARDTMRREIERANLPTPTRPTFTSAEPPELPEEQHRRIRRGQLENQIRMAQAVGRDAVEARRELEEMDREDTPVENFVPRRKVEFD